MIALMARTFEYSEEDEACGYRSIKDAQEDQCRNHERKRHFLIDLVPKRSKSGSGIVLGSSVGVNDARDDAENDDLADGYSPKRLWEILGVLHLSYKARDCNLPNERIADIQEGVRSAHKPGICHCHCQNVGFAGQQP